MLEFRNLTLAPIDRALIDPCRLDQSETDWLDAYHAEVLVRLESLCSQPTAAWLRKACAPLAGNMSGSVLAVRRRNRFRH